MGSSAAQPPRSRPWFAARIWYVSGPSPPALPHSVDRYAGLGAGHLDADCRPKPAGVAALRELGHSARDGLARAGVRLLPLRSPRRHIRRPARQTAAAVSYTDAADAVRFHARGTDGDGHGAVVDGGGDRFYFRRAAELRSAGARRAAAAAGAAGRLDEFDFAADADFQRGLDRGSAAGRRGGGRGRFSGRFRVEWLQLCRGNDFSHAAAAGANCVDGFGGPYTNLGRCAGNAGSDSKEARGFRRRAGLRGPALRRAIASASGPAICHKGFAWRRGASRLLVRRVGDWHSVGSP